MPVTQGLKKGDPFRLGGCEFGDPDCFVDEKQSCMEQSVCYRVVCNCCNTTVSEQLDTTDRPGSSPPTSPAPPAATATTPGSPVTGISRTRTLVVAGSRRPGNNREKRKIKEKNKCISFCPETNYVGTTGRTVHCRMMEHKEAIDKKDLKNALAKHMEDSHPNTVADFTMTIITRHNTNLERLVTESILIEKQVKGLSVNLRSEWGANRGVVRITAARI